MWQILTIWKHNLPRLPIPRANTNGDSDSVACIGGSISGAYLGIDAIPDKWIQLIEKTEYLDELAKRLAVKKETANG